MADITIKGPNLPFVLGGNGTFTVHAGTLDITKPLSKAVNSIFDVESGATASKPVSIGAPGAWTVAIKGEGSVKLAPVWPAMGNPTLVFTVGASADGKFSGNFRYGALTASASLEAAADVTLTYSHPISATAPLEDAVVTFFAGLQLPATISRPPEPGEVIKFEYGGYLALAGGVNAGYEVKGAPSFTIGQLLLSEHYDLSVIGKLGFTGQVGGFFGVEIGPGADANGTSLPAGWARIIVKKTRASEFTFAADASIGLTGSIEGLPDKPNDFLGALLGVNAKNWLNLLDDVKDLTTLDGIQNKLDSLAMNYLVTLVGKVVEDPNFLPTVLAKAKTIAEDYNNLDSTVLSAFDRYYDQITNPALGKQLGDAIANLAHLKSWDDLKGEVDPTVWSLVTELTGGDPLGWIVGKAVGEIQKKAQALLDLGSSAAHAELRAAIGLAKSTFGLTPLFSELAKVGTVEDLKAQGGKALGALVQRLLGDDIGKLNTSGLVALLTRVHKALDAASTFETNVYAKLKDVLQQRLDVQLHAEYSRASDNEALIDININASTPEGLALLQAAGRGDFQKALDSYRPSLVRLNSGRFTHNLVAESAISVNVVGWHAGWHFQGVEKLLLNTDQQIVTDAAGSLTAYTTVELTTAKDRKTTRDETFTNLLLRFVGESRGVLQHDSDNVEYLIDAITTMSAQYELGFQGETTSEKALAYYLGFAKEFGLNSPQLPAVEALLPRQATDNFGPMSVTYNVAYTNAGLLKLFGTPPDERVIRFVIREVILANYLAVGGALADAGWAYWTPDVRTLWEHTRPSFAKSIDQQFAIAPSPFARISSPGSVVLSPQMQDDVDVLYQIEDAFTTGLMKLESLITAGAQISPHDFENTLGDIGRALQMLRRFGESPNTIFAVIDKLLSVGGSAARASSMKLQSQVAGKQATKIFLS